ncbi:integrase core domain-containing protein [Streptomyces sp. NPDC002206]
MHIDTVLGRRLYVLAFLEHGTRRLRIAGITAHPTREWAVQQAWNLTNAHCERVIGSIRREALDHVLIMNEAHARRVLAAYEWHYNEHRPHRARNQLPPGADQQPITVHDLEVRRLLRTGILGGAINEYRYAV